MSTSLPPYAISVHMLATWHCWYLVAWCRTQIFLELLDIKLLLDQGCTTFSLLLATLRFYELRPPLHSR